MNLGRKSVAIPQELYRKVEEKVKASGFNSVDEYVSFVLEQVLSGDEDSGALSSADEAEVKKRLKALGYFE